MTTPTTHDEALERAARRRWVGIVLALLGGSLLLQLSFLGIAAADPSVAAEPDYYRKAVAWDEERAQQARNAALGWTVTPRAGGLDGMATRALELEVRDPAGRPVEGLRARALLFHKARLRSPVEGELRETAPGRYAARLPLRRAGRWELRLTLTRAQERFTLRRDLELDE